MPSPVIAGIVGFLVAVGLTRLVEVEGRRRQLLDLPNSRSSHVVPTPRLGGVGIVVGVSTGWIAGGGLADGAGGLVLLAGSGLAIVGFADDLGRGSVAGKYLAQLAASTMTAVALAPTLELSVGTVAITIDGPAAVALSAFWLTAIVNAFNFIDGIDGMLGGVAAVVALASLGILGDGSLAMVAVAGACLGFLVWNVSPASIFMGDVGSQFLGLWIGAALFRQSSGSAEVIPMILLCGVVLADTGFTLIRRALAGRNLFAAHREHLYQRLVISGRSHREVSAVYAAATALGGLGAHAWAYGSTLAQAAVGAALGAGLAALVLVVTAAERRGQAS